MAAKGQNSGVKLNLLARRFLLRKGAFGTLCLLLVAGLSLAQVPASQRAPLKLHWDFSHDNNLSHIEEPLKFLEMPNVDYVGNDATIDGPGHLTFDLENGLRGEADFWFIDVYRDPKRHDRATALRIWYAPQNQSDAADSAMALAKTWNITNTGAIEKFRRTSARSLEISRPHVQTVEFGPDGKFLAKQAARCSIQILDNGAPKTRFFVVLSVPLKENIDRGPSTMPTR